MERMHGRRQGECTLVLLSHIQPGERLMGSWAAAHSARTSACLFHVSVTSSTEGVVGEEVNTTSLLFAALLCGS